MHHANGRNWESPQHRGCLSVTCIHDLPAIRACCVHPPSLAKRSKQMKGGGCDCTRPTVAVGESPQIHGRLSETCNLNLPTDLPQIAISQKFAERSRLVSAARKPRHGASDHEAQRSHRKADSTHAAQREQHQTCGRGGGLRRGGDWGGERRERRGVGRGPRGRGDALE